LLTDGKGKTKRIGPQSQSGWACVGRVLYWDEILSQCCVAVCRFRLAMKVVIRVVIRDELLDVWFWIDVSSQWERKGRREKGMGWGGWMHPV
jgi:hypothetical protein